MKLSVRKNSLIADLSVNLDELSDISAGLVLLSTRQGYNVARVHAMADRIGKALGHMLCTPLSERRTPAPGSPAGPNTPGAPAGK